MEEKHEANSTAEIEITPEMIEAGVSALTDELCEDVSLPQWRSASVVRIYRAMHTAATRHRKSALGSQL